MVDSPNRPLLSNDLALTARALQQIRLRFAQMIAEGNLPPDLMPDVSTVMIFGFEVIKALNRLALFSAPLCIMIDWLLRRRYGIGSRSVRQRAFRIQFRPIPFGSL
jgi:hypothetical protein